MNDLDAKAKRIFLEAIERRSPDDLAVFVDAACGGNPTLRSRVEKLLRAHQQAGKFLGGPSPASGEPDTLTTDDPGADQPGTIIGPYKLLQQIGEGGMGTVFMAEQQEPVHRKVAVKIIKPGMDSRQVIARFEAERQALALMDHPNIAKVFDGGTTDSGRPYFVMELVHGIPMTRFCDERKLSTHERLALFVPVCQAIQHAHQKGIIHRDIKPSNVLVTMYDDKPVPKVIDFGVAKAVEQRLTELTMFTQFGALVGTFEYMSPEQAEMNAFGVDTRSDIYSLGVLLYELLTGTTPLEQKRLRQAALDELVRMIREEEAPRPSARLSSSNNLPKIAAERGTEPARLSRLVRGEIDWIVMKCLEKDRTRRYESANGLARDIQRYLADEPVEACPPTTGYRLRKLARKHSRILVTAGAFVLLLTAATLASTWQAIRATLAETKASRAQEVAQDERQQAVTNLYHARVEEAAALRRARGMGYRAKVFKRLQEALQLDTPDKDINQLRDEAVACLGDFVGLEPVIWDDFPEDVRSAGIQKIALTPHGELMAIALSNGTIQVRNVGTGGVAARLNEAAVGLGIDPDNRWLVTAGAKGTIKVWQEYGTIGTPAAQTIDMGVDFAGISTNGRFAVGFSQQRDGRLLLLWDVASQKVKARLKVHSEKFEGPLQVSDDGQWVAYASREGTKLYAWVWNTPIPEPKKIFFAETVQDTQALSITANGRLLACQHGDDGLILLDVREAVPRPLIRGQTGLAACFSRDARFLVYYDGWKVKLWDVANHREVASLDHPGGGITSSATFSDDGAVFATANKANHSIRVWKLVGSGEKLVLAGHDGGVADVVFSPDGKVLASASKDRRVKLWDVATGRLSRTLPAAQQRFQSSIQTIDFSPDGRLLATGQFGPAAQPVQVWDLATGKAFIPPDDELGQRAYGVAFSPDGKILAACGDGLTLWRIVEGAKGAENAPRPSFQRLTHLPGIRSLYVRISHNGKLLAWADYDLLVCLWDLANGCELPFTGPPSVGGWRNLAFYPDGDHLTFITARGMVETWDTRASRHVSSLEQQRVGPSASLDGRWLVASALWSNAGSRVFAFPELGSRAVSPDGERVAEGMWDGGLAIWDVPRIQAQLGRIGLAWPEDARGKERQEEPQPFVPATPREQQLQARQYSNLGKRLAWAGRVTEAEDAHRAALKVKSDDPGTHGRFGDFLADQARYKEAVAEFSDAIKLQPHHGSFWVQRGWAYADMGQWDKASVDFVRATQCQEPDADLYYARLDHLTDQYQLAQCNEADQDAWYARAMLYLRDGNLVGYRQVCSDMLQRFDEGAAWTCTLTPNSGADPDRIVDLAEKLLTKSSRDHWHVNELGAALYRAGRFEEALKRLTEATELHAHPYQTNMLYTWFFLAMAHQRLDHTTEARRWLDKASRPTEEALKPLAEPPEKSSMAAGTIPPNWARKLTLQLLRREAEQLVQSPRTEPAN